jgi:dTDP-4-dehydrorhamnose 3,5-epimerase
MVCRECGALSRSPADGHPGWHQLAGGAWLFRGQEFDDERGHSREIFDLTSRPEGFEGFVTAQENIVATRAAGCARGMHYQVPPYAQAKVATVVKGTAQFFWVSLREKSALPQVNSIMLTAGATSLYTPADCSHGFVAVDHDTRFLLKTSAPVSLDHRGQVNFLSKSLKFDFACPIREDLLSPRDQNAPEWEMRRQ